MKKYNLQDMYTVAYDIETKKNDLDHKRLTESNKKLYDRAFNTVKKKDITTDQLSTTYDIIVDGDDLDHIRSQRKKKVKKPKSKRKTKGCGCK